MNGAEWIVRSALKAGIALCFANPGTTELPLVEALDRVTGMRSILGLFEGVCTGAADGYARMAGKPAMTLLHLGPGFANGVANLHNARRAKTPMFNVIGEHASWHLPFDPLLAMDIEALAGSVSAWHGTVKSPEQLSADTRQAIAQALAGRISTLIVPNDYQWAQVEAPVARIPRTMGDPVDTRFIEQAAGLLKAGNRRALILGGRALSTAGLLLAGRIRSKTGCDLFYDTFPARLEQGAGYPDIARIPYLPETALETLAPYDTLICLGTRAPVAFFGYPGLPSAFITDAQSLLVMERGDDAIVEVLSGIAEAIGAPSTQEETALSGIHRPDLPSGKLDGTKAGIVLATVQPENAIVVEEAITNGQAYHGAINGCPNFTLLSLTGGSIGQGPPTATGAALACPDRPVINFQADGSAMYTVQSLWTQAREHLNVITLVCSNRSYDILKLEMARAGIATPGPSARRMTDLSGLDWVKLGEAQGVPSVSVETCEAMASALETAFKGQGPRLIELRLAG